MHSSLCTAAAAGEATPFVSGAERLDRAMGGTIGAIARVRACRACSSINVMHECHVVGNRMATQTERKKRKKRKTKRDFALAADWTRRTQRRKKRPIRLDDRHVTDRWASERTPSGAPPRGGGGGRGRASIFDLDATAPQWAAHRWAGRRDAAAIRITATALAASSAHSLIQLLF